MPPRVGAGVPLSLGARSPESAPVASPHCARWRPSPTLRASPPSRRHLPPPSSPALPPPYWALRCVLGLHAETPSPTRAYRKFLIRATHSRFWQRVERTLDWVWPKSLVLYGTRLARGRG